MFSASEGEGKNRVMLNPMVHLPPGEERDKASTVVQNLHTGEEKRENH